MNPMTDTAEMMNTLGFVLRILSIGAILGPVLAGCALWGISRVFVSRENFEEWKKRTESERGEMKVKITQIDDNVIELLQRTANNRDRATE